MAKGPECGKVTATSVLWILVFLGFAVNYMIRINMNIAIVAMVRKPTVKGGAGAVGGECFNQPTPLSVQGVGSTPGNFSFGTTELPLVHTTSLPLPHVAEEGFDWDERQQGLVLGAFFWMHWSTQLPGGILARRYGTKLIFGLANFIPVVLSFVIPFVSHWDYRALLFVRLAQGMIAGFAWPSMHQLTAKWIPPNERSRFVTAYLGSSVGAAMTFPLCGQLIHTWGWESVFYTCGAVGVAWYAMWCLLVFDSPSRHPRISAEELSYITDSIGKTVSEKKFATPWKAIFTSRGVWMVIVAQWGGVFGLFTLMTQAPSYFRYIHGWDIRMTGVLSGLPHVMRMIWAYIFSELGDFLLRTNKMSRTNVRKLATFCCDVVQGLLILCLMMSGCNSTAAIVFLTAATAAHGAVSTGPLASMVDLSPNFASIILGISGMITVVPGFISPAIVGALTYKNQTVGQWQKVFGITAVQLVVCGLLYVLFAQSELQPWNSPVDPVTKDMRELRPLKEAISKDSKDQKEEQAYKA